MQKDLGTLGAIVGMILVGCLFAGLALTIYPGWPAIGAWLHRIDAPAWVQAVGSIAAICAAVVIAYVQHRQTLRQSHRLAAQARSQAAAGPFAVAERTIAELKRTYTQIQQPLGTNDDWSSFPSLKMELQKLLFDFKSLPLHTLPGYEAIHAAYSLADAIDCAIYDLAEMSSIRDSLESIGYSRKKRFIDRMLDMAGDCKKLEAEWRSGL